MTDEPSPPEQSVQLNYVIPNELDGLLQRYCEQTLIPPSALVRRLVSDYIDGTVSITTRLGHPRGRRTTVALPSRLLENFEAKVQAEGHTTKAAVIAALLSNYLPQRVSTGETVRVVVDLPTSIHEKLHKLYGSGPIEALVLRGLEELGARECSKESSDARAV